MAYISEALRLKVAAAARHRCGYRLTAQRLSGAPLHVEHLIPLARGGTSDESNLWLSCAWCNSYKGALISAVDPISTQTVPLFNPRTQIWAEHFQWSADGIQIIGQTPTGRATVVALRLNNEYIVPARRQWVTAGWHPPRD